MIPNITITSTGKPTDGWTKPDPGKTADEKKEYLAKDNRIMAIGGFNEEYTVNKTQVRIEVLVKLTPQIATRIRKGRMYRNST